jgi:hypothetical protein
MNEENDNRSDIIVYGDITTPGGTIRDVTLGTDKVSLGLSANEAAVSIELDLDGADIVVGLTANTFWAMIALLAGAELSDVIESEDPPQIPIIRVDQDLSDEDVEQAEEDIEATAALLKAGAEFDAAMKRREQEGNQ